MNNRNLAIPLVGTSGVFFSGWLFLIASILENRVSGSFFISLPGPGHFYFFNGIFIFALFLIISFATSILLVLEVKRRSPQWTWGLPLCMLEGAAALSALFFTFLDPAGGNSVGFGYVFLVFFIAIPLLPFFSALFFYSVKNVFGESLSGSMILATGAGIAAVLLFLVSFLLPAEAASGSSPQSTMWNFGYPGLLLLIYLFFILPVPGLLFIRLGIRAGKPDDNREGNP
ncbi:MAG: hypothetical protein ABFC24_00380 [Methanoregulaceae archaeon]